MRTYEKEDIKQVADCVDVSERILGMTRVSESNGWVRFNCPWRNGSDSGAFAVKKEGWHDHVTKEHGDVGLDSYNVNNQG